MVTQWVCLVIFKQKSALDQFTTHRRHVGINAGCVTDVLIREFNRLGALIFP